MPRKIGPEAQIVGLFTALSDDSKRIVLEILKTQNATPRKASTKKPERSAPAQKDLPVGKTPSDALCVAQVPTLDVPCGEPKDALIHDPKGGYASYHEFEGPKPVKAAGKRSSRKRSEEPSTPPSETEKEAAISAGASE
jgi:hypothetical protein